MSEIQIFRSLEFGAIRTIEENGKVLFCGKDVADALGYDQPHKAIDRHCRYGMKHTVPHPQSKDKTIEMLFIPEGDLYRLIANSKLPSAEHFERWVFDEILPTIRKHGAYITTQKMEEIMNDPDSWIKVLTALKAERQEKERLQVQVAEDKPKVVFANAVSV